MFDMELKTSGAARQELVHYLDTPAVGKMACLLMIVKEKKAKK